MKIIRTIKNKEGQVALVLGSVIVVLAVLAMLMINVSQGHYVKELVNQKMVQLLGNVWEQYPDIAEEELIKLLNENSNSEAGFALLEKYGIDEDAYVLLEMGQWQRQFIWMNAVIMLLLAIMIAVVILWYLNCRRHRLEHLTGYVRAVSGGNYMLDLDENSEDELSNLKNELYKITVMLKEQADLSKMQKVALADSVSDISHQLKTPLTSVSVLLDNLSENADMEPQIRVKFLNEITRQIQQMNWLVVSLLKISRLDAGVVDFEMQEIALDEMLGEIAENLEIIAEIKSVAIIIQGAQDVCIRGDYSWNREAIQNIVKNAIEHTRDASEVVIKVEDNSVYTKIAVQNFGEGISESDIKHIFERFYKSKKTIEQGVGIGLSLAKTIIEQQNGYLTASSEEGAGTTFVIKYLK